MDERYVIKMTKDDKVQWIGKGPWDLSDSLQGALVMSRSSMLGKLRVWQKRVNSGSFAFTNAKLEVFTATIVCCPIPVAELA